MEKTELHQRIRLARKSAKLTQLQVADACKISREAVSQWEAADESKRTTPSIANLQTLSDVAGVALAWLVTGIEAESEKSLSPTSLTSLTTVSGSETATTSSNLAALAQMLAETPAELRPAVGKLLESLAMTPDNASVQESLEAILKSGGKR